MQQASRQRLLTRRARRRARQKNKYEELGQKVKKLILRFFMLLAPSQPKPAPSACCSPQRTLDCAF
jgi:hypothetical protein